MTRVALLAPCTWPEVHRGGERIHRELAAGLIERGHEPRLLTSHPGRPERVVEDGLPVIRNWRPPDRRLRRRLFEDYVTHVPFSYRTLATGHDEIAHAFHPPDALAAVRWSERTGRPALLTYLGVPTRRSLVQRRGRLDMLVRAARGCGAVVALSRTAADEFARTLGIDARVVYPGVDLDAFRPSENGRAESPTIFCAADPSAPYKRVPLLIEAFERLRRNSRPDARLVLTGSNANAIAGEGIVLVDPVSDPRRLAELYSSAWVSALPSWGESFGLVLAEALACGTPVVGARSGAVPEVVDRDEIGRLFDGDEPEALERALAEALELATDGNTSKACRKRAEEFSTDRATKEYLRLYEDLLTVDSRQPTPD